jgi:large subunit ribosomal protein L15
MKLHTLKPTDRRQARKRVGRGHGNNWGRTCGRGEKGQKSRSGYSRRPYFEGGQIPLFRRLPKRGFTNPNHKLWTLVNVRDLDTNFVAGETVDIESLTAKGMIGTIDTGLKILADGEISKSLTVKAHAYSATAKAKIEAAGGSCETL